MAELSNTVSRRSSIGDFYGSSWTGQQGEAFQPYRFKATMQIYFTLDGDFFQIAHCRIARSYRLINEMRQLDKTVLYSSEKAGSGLIYMIQTNSITSAFLNVQSSSNSNSSRDGQAELCRADGRTI